MLSEEEKQELLNKSPIDITTIDDACAYFLRHYQMRFNEDNTAKMTPIEKLAEKHDKTKKNNNKAIDSSTKETMNESQIADPRKFDVGALGKLDEHAICFWDETHKKCEVVNVAHSLGKDVTYSFKRDECGKLSKSGIYKDHDAKRINFKYDKEARLMLGVASLKYTDGKTVGVRLPPFDYTNKTIIPHNDFQKKVNESIKTIKDIIPDEYGRKGGWVVSSRRKGEIFEYDNINVLHGISEKKKHMLNEIGIHKVKDI